MRRLTINICCLTVLLGTQRATADERSVPDILKKIDAIREPSFPDSRRDDPAAVVAYKEKLGVAREREAVLTGELFRLSPDHPRLGWLLPRRWASLAGRGEPGLREVGEETRKVIGTSKNVMLRRDAAHWRLKLELDGEPTPEKVSGAVDRFLAATYRSENTASRILVFHRDLGEAQKRTLLRRVIDEFPDTQAAEQAEALMHRLDGVGKPFDLEFTDAISGKAVSMKSLKGKVVVLDFWATRCGPCVAEMPRMKRLYAEYRDKEVEFIGVSLDRGHGSLAKLKEFVRDNEIGWPQFYQGEDRMGKFSASWGVYSIPAVFVIDKEGRLFSEEALGKLETILPSLLNPR